MPVEDHAIHPSTVVKSGHVYGCHNNERSRESFMVKDGFTKGIQRFIEIEDCMSIECRYDKSLTDKACKGCKHAGSGEAYTNNIRQKG